jgi:hypothetical protein
MQVLSATIFLNSTKVSFLPIPLSPPQARLPISVPRILSGLGTQNIKFFVSHPSHAQ